MPGGQFTSSDNSESTLAVWAWAALAASGSAAGLRQLALCIAQLARDILTTRYWQSEPRCRGRQAVAAVEPANLKQVQIDAELALEVQVQVYWQVDPNHFEFQRAVTHFKVEV